MYTPWLTPIIIFLTFISFLSLQGDSKLIIKYKKSLILFIFTILIMCSFKFSITNKIILSNLFKDIYIFPKLPNLEFESVNFSPKHWKPLRENKEQPLIINVSKSDQCWNIPAPCSTDLSR